MSEALIRTEPVSREAFVCDDVSVSLAPPYARYALRARDPGELEALLGRKVPAKIGKTAGEIACLGPDEWLLRCAEGTMVPMGEGLPLAFTEHGVLMLSNVLRSERAVLMSIQVIRVFTRTREMLLPTRTCCWNWRSCATPPKSMAARSR